MKSLPFVSLLIFAGGFLTAWLVKPINNGPAESESSLEIKSSRTGSSGRSQRGSFDKRQADARLERLLNGETWNPKPGEDFRGLIETL